MLKTRYQYHIKLQIPIWFPPMEQRRDHYLDWNNSTLWDHAVQGQTQRDIVILKTVLFKLEQSYPQRANKIKVNMGLNIQALGAQLWETERSIPLENSKQTLKFTIAMKFRNPLKLLFWLWNKSQIFLIFSIFKQLEWNSQH